MNQLETIHHIYGAFGRGDVSAILTCLSEDVAWEYAIVPLGVPWLEPRRGRDEVPQFFAALAAFDLHRFEPKRFFESGHIVVVLIDVDLTVRATGTRIAEEDEVHIWYFDEKGRVTRFGHKLDSHQHWLACGGGAAPAKTKP
jgi:ketosteroid isomerase-like protein